MQGTKSRDFGPTFEHSAACSRNPKAAKRYPLPGGVNYLVLCRCKSSADKARQQAAGKAVIEHK
jgi:hypothetical protein